MHTYCTTNGRADPDADRIRDFIERAKHPGAPFGVRIVGKNGRDDRFFDVSDDAADYAYNASRGGNAVYYVLHQVGKLPEQGSVCDEHVRRYRYLPLDFDPVRFGVETQAVPAMAAEKEAAHQAMLDCRDYLAGLGFPDPIIGDSGNGYHLLYPIDLPNNDAARGLIKRCLEAANHMFGSDFRRRRYFGRQS